MPEPPDPAAVRAIGETNGLDAVGITHAGAFPEVRRTLEERKAAGLHATMNFTYRRPERSTDPAAALPGARSLVVGARRCRTGESRRPAAPAGRVAAYARHDHYRDLRDGLHAVARHLKRLGWRARVVADDNALVDRAAAHRAGLGWWGKNANLLLPDGGSWFVLGSVITTAPFDDEGAAVPDGCGPCRRCIDACPTGAIVAPGVVDARRCLSWLLQQEGPFPRQYRVALGDRIYGCDDCQEVCPPSRRAPVAGPAGRTWVQVLELLDGDDEAVLAEAGAWYIPRREVRYVRRNALVVLGNVADPADPAVQATLGRYLDHPDAMLRGHAVWAARRLGLDRLADTARDDADLGVREEAASPVPRRP